MATVRNGGGRLEDDRLIVLLLGPARDAVSGVSEHARQLLSAPFSCCVSIRHFQVGREGRSEGALSRWVRIVFSPIDLGLMIVRVQPSVVHVNTSLNRKSFWRDAAYMMTAKLLRRKVVCQVHGGLLKEFVERISWLERRLVSAALWLPDAVVVLSQRQLRYFQKLLPKQTPIFLIRNGIDVASYADAKKDFSGQSKKVVYVGRLDRDKGLFDLIEAVERLKMRNYRHVGVYIAGTGPDEDEMKRQIDARSVGDMVHPVGVVTGDGKRALWKSAHLFVLPSYHEGLPYAVLESLASGTPLVSSRVGALPEVLTDGVNVKFVETGKPEALAQAIIELSSNEGLLKEMSKECIRTAGEKFGINRLAAEFESLYTSLVTKGSGPKAVFAVDRRRR